LNVLPDNNWFGDINIIFYVSDEYLTTSSDFILTIESVNDIPIANNMNISLDEDSQTLVILEGEDIDNYELEYTIVSNPISGDYSLNASFLTYTPFSNYFGLDSLTYVVSDGIDLSNEATVLINVLSINDAPELPLLEDIIINEDESYQFEIPLYDVDNDTLFYEITISNNDAEYIFNDNILIITPNLNFNGEILISINVTDTELSDSAQFILNVTSINDPPVITSVPVSNILIGEIFEYI
ncbi:uncharacterized protein METZ01_LOCUS485954, partial [marine metagenome]